uniref:Putative acetyltransferase n=2 Tax=viral metagenome TaxID=1070528 RepID=A0A6M3KDN8_9ZZZZ
MPTYEELLVGMQAKQEAQTFELNGMLSGQNYDEVLKQFGRGPVGEESKGPQPLPGELVVPMKPSGEGVSESTSQFFKDMLTFPYGVAADTRDTLMLLDESAKQVSEWTGLGYGGLFKSLAAFVSPPADYAPEGLSRKIVDGIGRGLSQMALIALGAKAGVSPTVYFAGRGATEEGLAEGPTGALKGGIKGALLGKIFEGTALLPRGIHAPTLGGVFALLAASEGASGEDVAAAFGVGIGLGLGGGGRGLTKQSRRYEKLKSKLAKAGIDESRMLEMIDIPKEEWIGSIGKESGLSPAELKTLGYLADVKQGKASTADIRDMLERLGYRDEDVARLMKESPTVEHAEKEVVRTLKTLGFGETVISEMLLKARRPPGPRRFTVEESPYETRLPSVVGQKIEGVEGEVVGKVPRSQEGVALGTPVQQPIMERPVVRKGLIEEAGEATVLRPPGEGPVRTEPPVEARITPRQYQEQGPERTVHEDWNKANSPRFVFEGAGDILREFQKEYNDPGYIGEKLGRIREFIDGEESGRVHPDDSLGAAQRHAPDKLARLLEQYKNQPTETAQQTLAKDAVVALLEGRFGEARRLYDEIGKWADTKAETDFVPKQPDLGKPTGELSPGSMVATEYGLGKVIRAPEAGKVWVRLDKYVELPPPRADDPAQARRSVMKLDVSEVRSTEPPEGGVTLSFMGSQQMFNLFFKRVASKIKGRNPSVRQDILDLAQGKIVSHRSKPTSTGGRRWYPPVREMQLQALQMLKDIPHQVMNYAFETPMRTFERMGEMSKDLFYYPIRDADHAIVSEARKTMKWVKDLKGALPRRSSRRIMEYAIAQQPRGLAILQAQGVQQVPRLTPQETRVYDVLRDKFEDFYVRINGARTASGLPRMPYVNNYFTFMHMVGFMARQGVSPVFAKPQMMNKFVQLANTGFRFAKPRARKLANEYKMQMDAFGVFEQYMHKALEHIHKGPVISQLRQFLLTLTLPNKGKWSLVKQAPRTWSWLNEWLNFQAGKPVPSTFGNVRVPEWFEAHFLRRLNNNLAFSFLSFNLRSSLIQFSALRNAFPVVGAKHVAYGIGSLMSPEARRFVMKNSKHLPARDFDVAATDMVDIIKAGKFGKVKVKIGSIGTTPLRLLDLETSRITWMAAFRHGTKDLNMTERAAFRYADDIVVRTQASAAKSDITPFQRSSLGRSAALFQTFVLNDWNFLTKDILKLHDPNRVTKDVVKKLASYIIATTAMNVLYEDLLGLTSPYPSPIRAVLDELEGGGDVGDMSYALFKELIEPFPIVGGGIRYSSSPFGASAGFVGDVAAKFSGAPMAKPGLELLLKGAGIPGTAQVAKMIKAKGRGEGPLGIVLGQYEKPPKARKKVKGALGGLGGIGGL